MKAVLPCVLTINAGSGWFSDSAWRPRLLQISFAISESVIIEHLTAGDGAG